RQGGATSWVGIGELSHLILAQPSDCQWLAGKPQARDYSPNPDETPPPATGIRAAKGGTMSAPMNLPRRREFLRLAAGAAALPVLSGLARAQTDPSRTIRLVVPFPPGGSVDQISRMVQAGLQQRLGATVIVENKPGASGAI